MSAPVLIAYATRGGSTTEVAHAIAGSLNEAGLLSEVLPMRDVHSLAERPGVILGAPLYIGQFPDEFHNFLARHREALALMRPWCFVLGPTRSVPADFLAAQMQAEKQLARRSWLQPASLQIFGGRWDMDRLAFPFSLARHLPVSLISRIPPSDIRDWAAIRAWAQEVASQIKSAPELSAAPIL
jgi:menaquinone-dependent protoporphyrinogen oxidase